MNASGAPWNCVPKVRQRIMCAIRPRDTKPELALRSMLHAEGRRCRDLPGRPGVVLRGRRKIIELRGCILHAPGACTPAIPPRGTSTGSRSSRVMRREELKTSGRCGISGGAWSWSKNASAQP